MEEETEALAPVTQLASGHPGLKLSSCAPAFEWVKVKKESLYGAT